MRKSGIALIAVVTELAVIWVANYSGTIQVFADKDRLPMVPR